MAKGKGSAIMAIIAPKQGATFGGGKSKPKPEHKMERPAEKKESRR